MTEIKAHPALGDWLELAWRPPPGDPLQDLVNCIWHREGIVWSHFDYRVLPHGMTEVAGLLNGQYSIRSNGRLEPVPPLVLIGQHLAPKAFRAPTSRFRCIGIRLLPEGCRLLWHGSMVELTDRVIHLEALGGESADDVLEQLYDCNSGHAIIEWARRWLTQRLLPLIEIKGASRAVRWSLKQIEATGGAISISDLSGSAGVSATNLIRGIREVTGITPKRYCRIQRFRRTLELLQDARIELSQVALEAHYYDQAHMSNEFRDFSGMTPGAYRQDVDNQPVPYRVLER